MSTMNVPLFLEIKNEYTEHLVDTLTPYIYEGLNSIYKDAVKFAEESNCENKTLLIFQKLLQSVCTWNQIRVEEETIRIKQLSHTSEYLDELVKAVVKSNIILLAYSNTISNLIGQTFYNTLTTSTFVHRCYTEAAKDAHNNPYLFFHKAEPMDFKRNQIIIQDNIKAATVRAISKILPISMILKEYLANSMNIVQEPTKVELMGMPAPVVPDVPIIGAQPKIPTNPPKIQSEKKLEKEVMQMIDTENGKTNQQKIKDIMGIDKLINSIEPKVVAEMSAQKSTPNSKKVLSSITKKRTSEIKVAPLLVENDYDNDIANSRLNASDKQILNINFDDQPTIDGNVRKTVSATTISNRPMPQYGNQSMYTETSERIDPEKVQLIEDYGQDGRKIRRK